MSLLDAVPVSCPYCGEIIDVDVDLSAGARAYVEDCHVCCQPMVLEIAIGADGGARVVARQENE